MCSSDSLTNPDHEFPLCQQTLVTKSQIFKSVFLSFTNIKPLSQKFVTDRVMTDLVCSSGSPDSCFTDVSLIMVYYGERATRQNFKQV